MRINVYTEELFDLSADNNPPPKAEIVRATYVSSRTGETMTNYGLRIYVKSAPELHYIPGRDDDRSAVTFWCGPKEKNVFAFLEEVKRWAEMSSLHTWHDKVGGDIQQAEDKL